MRLALLSDVHANLHALKACIVHARAHHVERFVFLGDLVGYGGDPAEVVDQVMQLTYEEDAIVLLGNHDVAAINPPRTIVTMGDHSAAWTQSQLSPEHIAWLDSHPLTMQLEQNLFVHASAHAPYAWHYVYERHAAYASLEAASAWEGVRYVFCGHAHIHTLFYQEPGATRAHSIRIPAMPKIRLSPQKRWHISVGSVGQPRDGNAEAMYCILDTPDNPSDIHSVDPSYISFHRVPYDHGAAADAIRRAGLNPFFASRLAEGR